MSTRWKTDPSPARKLSPLCLGEYRRGLSELAPVIPPGWMRTGLLAALILTVGICAITLLSPMDEYVTAPGQVRPAEYAFVYSRTSGILETIEIDEGQAVRRGQTLARLDGWEIRKQLTEIDGDIAQTQAELAMARASAQKVAAAPVPPEFLFSAVEVERQTEIQSLQQDYLNRLNTLQKSGAASTSETLNLRLQLIATESFLKRSQQAYELFKGEYGAASQMEAKEKERMIEARLAALQSKRSAAEADLKRLEITAPEDGIILATARRFPGERVEAGMPLFKITDESRSELRLYATEDRVNLIQPGQLVRFRANNNPDRLAPLAVGRVTEVARDRDLEMGGDSEGSAPTRSYRVKVAIEKEPYPLAVGATVNAEIILEKRPFWRLLLLKRNADS